MLEGYFYKRKKGGEKEKGQWRIVVYSEVDCKPMVYSKVNLGGEEERKIVYVDTVEGYLGRGKWLCSFRNCLAATLPAVR